METLSDEFASQRQLAIVERFEGFLNYLYPVALNISRVHHVARALTSFVASWRGHAQWANSFNLLNRLGVV